MATKPNRLSAARRYEGELNPSIQDRWYQQIQDVGNSGATWSAITGGDGSPTTGDTTLTTEDSFVRVDSSAGVVIMTLPTAVGILGREYEIKKVDDSGNKVTVQPFGIETIDGCNPMDIIFQYDSMRIVSNNVGWDII